jgi:hypothetical protein
MKTLIFLIILFIPIFTYSQVMIDSTAIKKIDIRIESLNSDVLAIQKQQEKLKDMLLRIEGALLILQEQRNEEVAKLDSLANLKKKK